MLYFFGFIFAPPLKIKKNLNSIRNETIILIIYYWHDIERKSLKLTLNVYQQIRIIESFFFFSRVNYEKMFSFLFLNE